MLSKCGAREDSWDSLGLQGDQISQSKGNQPWIFTGRTATETPIFWPPDAKSWFTGKDPDAGKDWRQKEKEETEDDGWMASQINGQEFEKTLEDSGGHRSLACCSPWGHKALDVNYRENSNSSKSLTFPLEHAFPKGNVLISTSSAVLRRFRTFNIRNWWLLFPQQFFRQPTFLLSCFRMSSKKQQGCIINTLLENLFP